MRPESVAKGGYYPTPSKVINDISNIIKVNKYHGANRFSHLLDPCCGEGTAIKQLANNLNSRHNRPHHQYSHSFITWGIELNQKREETSREVLDHSLNKDAFSVNIGNSDFQLLFLNPPYDTEPDMERLEYKFLREFTNNLDRQGLLVYIIPRKTLRVTAPFLAEQYSNLLYWNFPDGERERFDQIIIIGTKRYYPKNNNYRVLHDLLEFANGTNIKTKEHIQLEMLINDATPCIFSVSDAKRKILFEAEEENIDEILSIANSMFNKNRELFEKIDPILFEKRIERPLMPLREGHLLQLIAAGMMNDMVLKGDTKRHLPDMLIKGTEKKTIETTDTDTKIVNTEQSETIIVYLDLEKWMFGEVT